MCAVLKADWTQSNLISSRSRDTSSLRDWSSDVCSSDRSGSTPNRDFANYTVGTVSGTKFEDRNADGSTSGDPTLGGWVIRAYTNAATRSEERRVGKEGRYGR